MQHDRLPVILAKACVDPLRERNHVARDRLVRGQRRAAWRADLQQRYLPAQVGPSLEQQLERLQALAQAFRVIHAIDTDQQSHARRDAELAAHRVTDAGRGHIIPGRPRNRNRVGAGVRCAAALDAGNGSARQAEVGQIGRRLQAHHGAGQQARHHLLRPWERGQGLRRRERNVPEQDDDGVRQLLAHHLRHQRQVVVLHQHHGPLARGFGNHGVGKAAVDGHVMRPVVKAEGRRDAGAVAQRPQRLVGQAIVIAGHFGIAEPQAAQPVRRVQMLGQDVVVGVDRGAVGRAAAMGDPAAAFFGQDGFERRHQAAGGPLGIDAVTRLRMHARCAVGHDDQVVATAKLFDQAGQVGAVAHVLGQ